jgi:TPP-dependent pyruvate/acetoin dehydrogenase alpha subunit
MGGYHCGILPRSFGGIMGKATGVSKGKGARCTWRNVTKNFWGGHAV